MRTNSLDHLTRTLYVTLFVVFCLGLAIGMLIQAIVPAIIKIHRSVVQLVIDYLDHYKDDPATTVIREDGTPATELSFRFELDWGPQASQEDEAICRAREQGNFDEVTNIDQPYLLCGHLDRVVTFNDSIFVMDHKTTTATLSVLLLRPMVAVQPNDPLHHRGSGRS